MSNLLPELQEWLQITNVRAFLRVIRSGESNQDDSAFRLMYGGEMFQTFRDHPRKAITKNGITSTAAGAYQFLSKTWDGLVAQYGFEDFGPRNQDLAAVALIKGRKALDAVIAGRLHEAIRLCGREWASLPESPYGQKTKTLAQCEAVYLQYGGTLAGPTTPAVPSEVKPMAPIVIPILQSLTALLPQLGQLFGSGSEVSNRNIAAGTILADTITKATESINLQEAAEKIQNDPAMRAAANAAVADVWPSITESGGGGIKAARDAANDPNAIVPWRNAAVWITVALLPLIYGAGYAVLYTDKFSDDLKTVVVTAIFAGLLGSITGFFLGSSLGSQKKDGLLGK